MKHRRPKSHSKPNKFCGETGCKLGFIHWHEGTLIKTPGLEPDAQRRLGPVELPEPVTDDMVAKIEAGVKALSCSDDPEADRFKGKSSEEARAIVLSEKITKLTDMIDHLQLAEVDHAEAFRCKLDNVYKIISNHIATTSGIGQQISNRIQPLDSRITQIRDTLDHVVKTNAVGRVALHIENIGRAQGEAWSTLRQVKDFIENWRLYDNDRHTDDGRNFVARYAAVMSLLQDIHRTAGKKPEFWTIMLASMAGGAALFTLITIFIVLGFLANQYWG